MNVQRKSVVRNIITIWLVSLVACCVCDIVKIRGTVVALTSTHVLPSSATAAFLLFFLVALADGILLGITLADQPQRKRKIVLFSILFAASFFLCHLITFVIFALIVDGASAPTASNPMIVLFGGMAAIYTIEGILFGLLSSLITNKVCKKK